MRINYESCSIIYFSLSTLGHGEHPAVTSAVTDFKYIYVCLCVYVKYNLILML